MERQRVWMIGHRRKVQTRSFLYDMSEVCKADFGNFEECCTVLKQMINRLAFGMVYVEPISGQIADDLSVLLPHGPNFTIHYRWQRSYQHSLREAEQILCLALALLQRRRPSLRSHPTCDLNGNFANTIKYPWIGSWGCCVITISEK